MFAFRNAQYEYNLFDLYAAPEIAQHLEVLARQGWQLERIGPVFWRYRKCPPAALHYAVVYFPKDPADEYISRQQRELWELCRATGWELAATVGQMQIFCTAEKEPIPIETDPVVQVETIHTAMRVRDSVLLAGSLIFYALLLLPLLLLTRSIGDRAAWFRLFLPALSLYILPCCITFVSHLLWYRSARQTAQNENRLQAPKGNRRLNAVHIVLAFICLFLCLFSVVTERNYYIHAGRCGHPRDDSSAGSLFQTPLPASAAWKAKCPRDRVSCGSPRFRAGSLPWLHCGPPQHFRASKC